MDAARRNRWVHNLRSGKYKQTRGDLYTAGGYCALGVLLEGEGLMDTPNPYEKIRALVGPRYDRVIMMNDIRGNSFDEIADWVEEHIPVDGDIGEPEKTIEVLPATEPAQVPEPVTEPEREPEPVH